MAMGPVGGMVVVFDFGGVLLDWNPSDLFQTLLGVDAPSAARFMEEIGYHAWNVELDRGAPMGRSVEELAARFPRHAEVIRAYGERWVETVRGPIPGSVELLRELRERGVELHALSNWSAESFARVRHRYPFFGWFSSIVLSGEVGLVKPDPRIFRLLLEKIGRTGPECLFIDDNPENIAAADGLGIRTIRFTTAEALRGELQGWGLLAGVAPRRGPGPARGAG